MDRRERISYRVHSSSTMMKKFKTVEDYIRNEINVREIQLRNLSLPFQLYKLINAKKALTVFEYYIKLIKQSYEEALGLKTDSRKLSIIIIFLLRNDRSFIYSIRPYFPIIYSLLPSRLKRKGLEYLFKKHNKSV